jgi:hypothetical protein
VADRVAGLEAQLQLVAFEKRHGNFRETMNDPKFIEWLGKTPHRVKLAHGAVNGDFSAADELFSLYEENRSPEPKAGDGEASVKQAGLARPGGSSAARVVGTNSGKKIFSRKELMLMRLNDPDEFDRLQPEILSAYREKRVK